MDIGRLLGQVELRDTDLYEAKSRYTAHIEDRAFLWPDEASYAYVDLPPKIIKGKHLSRCIIGSLPPDAEGVVLYKCYTFGDVDVPSSCVIIGRSDLEGADYLDIRSKGGALRSTTLSTSALPMRNLHMDLQDCELKNTAFRNLNLIDTYFTDTLVQDCVFGSCNFHTFLFEGSSFVNVRFENCLFVEGMLPLYLILEGCTFSNCVFAYTTDLFEYFGTAMGDKKSEIINSYRYYHEGNKPIKPFTLIPVTPSEVEGSLDNFGLFEVSYSP